MLTPAQIATLKTAINAETDPTFVALRNAGATGAMAEWFNQPHATFIVWKTQVGIVEIGNAIVSTELVGLTSINLQRLQTISDYSDGTLNPSLADRRAAFDDVFSGAGGTNTRPRLLALWKRFATRGERVFATGTGTSASPGTLVFEGAITDADVVQAVNS